jgi:hypothetical protein
MYYLANQAISGTTTFYRLCYTSGTFTDHMDSNVAGEGGYTTEGPIGYAWTTEGPGMYNLQRDYNSSTLDHATWSPLVAAPSGYTSALFGIFGYPRYGLTRTSLLNVSGGNVSVDSNGVSGGAIWDWKWYNGSQWIQFVNDYDNGREIQSDVFENVGGANYVNPTEAGDCTDPVCNDSSSETGEIYHGSPVVCLNTSGSVQTTYSIPFEWNPNNFGGRQSRDVRSDVHRKGPHAQFQQLAERCEVPGVLLHAHGYPELPYGVPDSVSPFLL